VRYFAGLGYTCFAPVGPFHDGEPAHLRSNINPGLGQLSFAQVVANLSNYKAYTDPHGVREFKESLDRAR